MLNLGSGMGMNRWGLDEMGLKKASPLISSTTAPCHGDNGTSGGSGHSLFYHLPLGHPPITATETLTNFLLTYQFRVMAVVNVRDRLGYY